MVPINESASILCEIVQGDSPYAIAHRRKIPVSDVILVMREVGPSVVAAFSSADHTQFLGVAIVDLWRRISRLDRATDAVIRPIMDGTSEYIKQEGGKDGEDGTMFAMSDASKRLSAATGAEALIMQMWRELDKLIVRYNTEKRRAGVSTPTEYNIMLRDALVQHGRYAEAALLKEDTGTGSLLENIGAAIAFAASGRK